MPKYILAIDSGSTGIRAVLFAQNGEIVAKEYEKTPAEYPSPGAIEHDPLLVWEKLLIVVKRVFTKFNPNDVAAIGITNQRASFCLWDKKTGDPLCKFINWADVRAAETVASMNKNPRWRLIKIICGIGAIITRIPMLLSAKLLNFTTDHASSRLKWLLDNRPDLRSKCEAGEALFGTIDTWLIYKLTGHLVHATDYSNAAATGIFNPFLLHWNGIICNLFKIPLKIFPIVKETNGDFGHTSKDLFGMEIPIHSAIGDQQAALFGHCCFEPGDAKISQGSGAFVDINVGKRPKISTRGLFPLIAWYLHDKPTYMLEGFVATAGTLIDWLGQGIGLSDTPKALNELAAQCQDSEGVIFIPSNSGIRFPYFNPRARGSILGLSLSSHRMHVARAVLEGIAHSLDDILEGIEKDTKVKIRQIRVDGGVSKSDILLQILADFTKIIVKRPPESDMTATGAAYLAGLVVGFWKDKAELKTLERNSMEFSPKMAEETQKVKRSEWKKAIEAILNVY